MRLSDPTPVLHLQGYGVCFGRKVVLSSVDLTLPSVGIDVLMGPVKTGKSTLMRSLAGLNDASSLFRFYGQAQLLGEPITPTHRPSIVQQHARVLQGRVVDALLAPVRAAALHQATPHGALNPRDVLGEHGLDALISHLDSPVLDLPLEWQRAVGILSHALIQPPLLMVDEPTFDLDGVAAQRLIDWLRRLGQTQRLLVTLHHQGQARRLADRVVLLAGGRVLAHQATEDFFTRPAGAWVEQFVRTGSLSIASPDAAPDTLADDVPAPPPLPDAAWQVLATVPDDSTAATATPPNSESAPEKQDDITRDAAQTSAHAVQDAAAQDAAQIPSGGLAASSESAQSVIAPVPQPPAQRQRAPLTFSSWGVAAAARVGLDFQRGRIGPEGFVWIIPDKLAGCPEPGVVAPMDYDLDLLTWARVSCLITLTENDLPQDVLARHRLTNLHLPIRDREPPSIGQTYMLIKRMQRLMEQGEVLAVHCKAGIGRTGTVLAAWLIQEGGLSAETAIQRLRRIKPTFVQTQEQEEFLYQFEQDILLRVG